MPTTSRPPGWPEIVAAAAVYTLCYFTLPSAASSLTDGAPVARGLALAALSGILGLLAFLAAYVIRIRRWSAFGIRRISLRWVLIAVGMGLVAVLLSRLGALAMVLITGDAGADPQGDYRSAASGGAVALILQLLFIAVLTPIGEEFAFRAVLTNALSRYGAVVSVIGSTAVFAVAHGLNAVLVPAAIVGAINAILFLRSKSVWPGVIVHAVNNVVATILPLLLVG